MTDRRIKIAKDKAKLVKSLKATDETNGPFQTYVDVLVFAAVLGMRRQKRVAILEPTKDLDPIRREYFDNYELIINLITIFETQNPHMLVNNQEADEQRIGIFEEYANGGLEILQEELRGAVDYCERIILLLSSERSHKEEQQEDFNLSRFMS